VSSLIDRIFKCNCLVSTCLFTFVTEKQEEQFIFTGAIFFQPKPTVNTLLFKRASKKAVF